jgi:non-heme chloroperoxidase
VTASGENAHRALYDRAVLRVATITLASGLNLSYAEQGAESGPTVVLLPGPTDSWRSYQPVLDRLPHWIRAIAVSQRGHGESDKPASGYAVEHFAGDVIELLNALEIERTVLVGHGGSPSTIRRASPAWFSRPHRPASAPTRRVGSWTPSS